MPSVPSEATSPVCGLKNVDAEHFDAQPAVGERLDADIGLAEDHEEVPAPVRLEIAAHMQVGVHPRFQHRHAAELVEFGGRGVVVEGAGDQHVEAGVARLARGGDEIGARDRAKLRADEDARPRLLRALRAPLVFFVFFFVSLVFFFNTKDTEGFTKVAEETRTTQM